MEYRSKNHKLMNKNDNIPMLKMIYFTIGAMILALGGAAMWIGIIFGYVQLIIIGVIVNLVNLTISIICHFIKKDKIDHRHMDHYECSLQRWYTSIISIVFSLGFAAFWIGLIFNLVQLLCIGLIFLALILFTMFFDMKIYRQPKK